ncbi:MAG TPA: hypothetical protein VF414_17875 [Thermoanaerobaculia bacterium]
MDPVILAVYGNVVLERAECPLCRDWAFVRDGASACCGEPVPGAGSAQKFKRMSEPEYRRRRPSVGEQAVILDAQGHRCLYCDRSFGGYYWRNGRVLKVQVAWDHFLPYSMTANNYGYNFVAACRLCNGIKSNKVFQTVEEVRIYVQARAEAKGVARGGVPAVREPISQVKSEPTLLPAKVPVGSVEPSPSKNRSRSEARARRREPSAKARADKAASKAATPGQRRPDSIPAGPKRSGERRPIAAGGGAPSRRRDVPTVALDVSVFYGMTGLIPPKGREREPTWKLWGVCHHCGAMFDRNTRADHYCSGICSKLAHKEAA